jgi:hypothetical protein
MLMSLGSCSMMLFIIFAHITRVFLASTAQAFAIVGLYVGATSLGEDGTFDKKHFNGY